LKTRSEERVEFLRDCLCGAVENYGYGFFEVLEYVWEDTPDPYALVVDKNDEEDTTQYRIDLDLIAKGLGIIKRAQVEPDEDNNSSYLVNADTRERLYVGHEQRRNIMLADRTNGEDGDLDVIDYLAIVECGLFGAVMYA
jgi:hypothetical protein